MAQEIIEVQLVEHARRLPYSKHRQWLGWTNATEVLWSGNQSKRKRNKPTTNGPGRASANLPALAPGGGGSRGRRSGLTWRHRRRTEGGIPDPDVDPPDLLHEVGEPHVAIRAFR